VERREHVDQRLERTEGEDQRGAAERDRASERDEEQDALAAVAVAEQGGERRRQGGGDHPDEPDEADRERSARLVCEHAERHEICRLASDRAGVRQLDAPEPPVPRDGAEGRDQLPQPRTEAAHPASIPQTAASVKEVQSRAVRKMHILAARSGNVGVCGQNLC
jgi:hypothetical protein